MSAVLTYRALVPWVPATRAMVAEVAVDLAALDRAELLGLRASDRPEDAVADLGNMIAAGCLFDGFVALRRLGGEDVPVAFAAAFRDSMPKVANIVFFGRAGHARVMPDVYRELGRRSHTFADRFGVCMAQVPILAAHRAARRMARSIGAQEVFHYGPVGRGGEDYVHAVWRLRHGRLIRVEAEDHRAEAGDHAI